MDNNLFYTIILIVLMSVQFQIISAQISDDMEEILNTINQQCIERD